MAVPVRWKRNTGVSGAGRQESPPLITAVKGKDGLGHGRDGRRKPCGVSSASLKSSSNRHIGASYPTAAGSKHMYQYRQKIVRSRSGHRRRRPCAGAEQQHNHRPIRQALPANTRCTQANPDVVFSLPPVLAAASWRSDRAGAISAERRLTAAALPASCASFLRISCGNSRKYRPPGRKS
jgi:hypothetical protein